MSYYEETKREIKKAIKSLKRDEVKSVKFYLNDLPKFELTEYLPYKLYFDGEYWFIVFHKGHVYGGSCLFTKCAKVYGEKVI